jgi:hypothetical protein
MTTTALILSHYPERKANVAKIIRDIKSGSSVPERILVFFDYQTAFDSYGDNVTVLSSTNGFPVSTRLAVASMCQGTHVWSIDDDMSVLPNTFATLMDFAKTAQKSVIGFDGHRLANTKKAYTDGKEIYRPAEATQADIILRMWLAPIYSASTAMSFYHRYPEIPNRYTDDIMLCMVNSLSMGNSNFVLPITSESGFYELNDGGVGQCKESAHYSIRNAVCSKLIKEYVGDKLCTSL